MVTIAGGAPPGAPTAERRVGAMDPAWQIAVAFLGLSVLSQLAAGAVLLAVADDLAAGRFYGPEQLAAVHLYGLGFLTVAIVGALFRLVPVLVRQRVCRSPVAAGIGGALALGAWLLSAGLWSDASWATATGGSLLVAGGGAFVSFLAGALWRARRAGTFGPTGAGMALAGLWFAVVLALGALTAANRIHPFLEVDRLRLIAAHATVALVGWVGGTILAVSLRSAPMFALAHGYPRMPGVATLVLWHLAVPLVAVGFGIGSAPLAIAGGLVLLAACAAGGVFLAGVLRHGRRRLQAPLNHLALGLLATAGAVLALLLTRTGAYGVWDAVVPAVLAVLVGLGSGVTSGHLFKVVPMIVWTGRYAFLVGIGGAPKLADLYPRSFAAIEQAAFLAGLPLLIGGVAGGSGMVAQAGAALLVLAAGAVAVAMAAVIFRRPRPLSAHPASPLAEPAR